MKRRDLLRSLGLLPLISAPFRSVFADKTVPMPSSYAGFYLGENLLQELGIRTFINAAGTYTVMTASLMHKEVVDAIAQSADSFCMLEEVQDKVGERIAKIVHAESAMVTAGASSALTLGMAGILTGTDQQKIKALPKDLEEAGMKSEVVYQKSHNMGYEHALRDTGITLVPVETVTDVRRAVNEKTAAMFFLNTWANRGKIQHKEWLDLAREFHVPTIIDIAADVPPVENLWKYNDMGFDLVTLSGGKGLRGPQSTGILMGKKELIAAARMNNSPHTVTIGRGMKVNKEEILGLYAALVRYIHQDHKKEWAMWEDRAGNIYNAVKDIDGVQAKKYVPDSPNIHTPQVHIVWDKRKIKINREDFMSRLRNGTPSVEVFGSENDDGFNATVFMLKPGEAEIVGRRLREEFLKLT